MADTETHRTNDQYGHAAQAGETTPATDPVCGMKVDAATSKHQHIYGGTEYHFCSARCEEKFIANPAPYLTPSA